MNPASYPCSKVRNFCCSRFTNFSPQSANTRDSLSKTYEIQYPMLFFGPRFVGRQVEKWIAFRTRAARFAISADLEWPIFLPVAFSYIPVPRASTGILLPLVERRQCGRQNRPLLQKTIFGVPRRVELGRRDFLAGRHTEGFVQCAGIFNCVFDPVCHFGSTLVF
jgi:hypothetical protein